WSGAGGRWGWGRWDGLVVDGAGAGAEARRWDEVDLRKCGLRRVGSGIEPSHRPATREHANRIPDGAVDGARHHRIGAHVLGRIHGLARLGLWIALAVAVGIEHECRPTLKRRRITSLIELLAVEPARNLTAAAGPDRVIGVIAKLQMMRPEAGVDELVGHGLGFEHGKLAHVLFDWKQLGRWMARSLLAELRVVRSADGGRHPQPALVVEH